MAHRGTLRYSTVLDGTLRYSTVLYGTLRYSTVLYGTTGPWRTSCCRSDKDAEVRLARSEAVEPLQQSRCRCGLSGRARGSDWGPAQTGATKANRQLGVGALHAQLFVQEGVRSKTQKKDTPKRAHAQARTRPRKHTHKSTPQKSTRAHAVRPARARSRSAVGGTACPSRTSACCRSSSTAAAPSGRAYVGHQASLRRKAGTLIERLSALPLGPRST